MPTRAQIRRTAKGAEGGCGRARLVAALFAVGGEEARGEEGGRGGVGGWGGVHDVGGEHDVGACFEEKGRGGGEEGGGCDGAEEGEDGVEAESFVVGGQEEGAGGFEKGEAERVGWEIGGWGGRSRSGDGAGEFESERG